MKLYTEEQVVRAIKLALDSPYHSHLVVDYLTPIELPSDEEIDNEFAPANEIIDEVTYMFIEGAKWMRDKIQGGNK